MSKKGKIRYYAEVKGMGENCPKCLKPMERRKRILPPKNKSYFFTEWDYCKLCSHVQHYEKFKSSEWVEQERQESFFRDLRNEDTGNTTNLY